MTHYSNVFEPIKIGNVLVKNRIEFPPAIPCLATADGYVTRELIEFEKSLARGGAGIVNIGDTAIDFDYASDHEAQINLGTDKVIPGLSTLVESIHRYGAKASVELNHGGRFTAPQRLNGKKPIGPSPISSNSEEMFAGLEGRRKVQIQEMDHDMIEEVISHYTDAVFRCMQAGFEMVMLHGGHGHLLAQFLSPYSNKRTDGYGGSLENRAKFAMEVLTAIRRKVGNGVALEYRISLTEHMPGGMEEEETLEFIKMIEDKIDLVNVSVGLLTDPITIPHMIQPTYFPHAYNVHCAERVKKVVRIPVVTVGSISDLETADRIIAEGKADIVAMARAQIADPDIHNKSRLGRLDEVRPCVRCNSCTHRISHFYPIRCAVNPVVGREVEFGNIRPAEEKKKVVIVGGGPAGMEAAIVASSRGHQVTLYEKEDKLGGTLSMAAALPFKADMKRYLDWLIMTTGRHSVEVRLSAEATADSIRSAQPDVLILAVGAEPQDPDIPGVKKSSVVSAGAVVIGEAKIGETVVVAGGGMTGCETALHLAQQGKKVTIIDMLGQSEIAQDIPILNRLGLMGLLQMNGVEIKTEVKLEAVTDQGAMVIDKQWQRHEIAADTVVIAFGYKARSETVKMLQGLVPETYVIGDCSSPRNLMAAIHDAFNIAVEI